MSTILIGILGSLLAIIILSRIPGLEHLVKPTIDHLMRLGKFLVENAFAWVIWFIKYVLNAHLDLLKNLYTPATELDPSLEMKSKRAA